MRDDVAVDKKNFPPKIISFHPRLMNTDTLKKKKKNYAYTTNLAMSVLVQKFKYHNWSIN